MKKNDMISQSEKIFLLVVFLLLSQIHEVISQPDTQLTSLDTTKISITGSTSESNNKSEVSQSEVALDILGKAIDVGGIVITVFSILLGLLSIIITVGIALGFFEYRRWKSIAVETNILFTDTKERLKKIDETYINMEKLLLSFNSKVDNVVRAKNRLEQYSQPFLNSLSIMPTWKYRNISAEDMEKFEILIDLIKQIEFFGKELNSKDAYYIGLHMFMKKNLDEACQRLEQSVLLDEENGYAYLFLGIVRNLLDKPNESIDAYDQAERYLPYLTRIKRNRAYVNLRIDQYQKAISEFNFILDLGEKYADTYNGISISYEFLGEHEKANDFYKKAISKDSRFKTDIEELAIDFAYSQKHVTIMKSISSRL